MLDLEICGFLAEGPHHGYELRRRIDELHGDGRALSDGTIYPALKRLEAAGIVESTLEQGAKGRPRRVYALTDRGREHLASLLAEPTEAQIRSLPSFLSLLAFLRHLPDASLRTRVLKRRLAALSAPVSFFYDDGEPVRSSTVDDPYRRGMFEIAKAARQAEKHWLLQEIDDSRAASE